jgi:hypothetical protein
MSKAFTAKVFRWLHQVNADTKLPASAAKVAIRLSPDFNEGRGGMAWSAFKTMADDIGLSERHVIRAIHALEARGHLKVKWGKRGRGHSSQYWMLEREPDLFDDQKPAPAPVFQQNKTGISGTGKPASGVRKPASVVVKLAPAPETHTRPTDEPSRGTHRVPKTQPPDQVGKKKEAGGGRKTSPSASGQRGSSGDRRGAAAAADDGEAFARFWAIYPRHDRRERARQAFARAIKNDDPEVIIERARVYALTERARVESGEDPKYTLYAVNWLRDRPWEGPLPPGTVVDNETGKVVGFEQPQEEEERSGVEDMLAYMARTHGGWWAT